MYQNLLTSQIFCSSKHLLVLQTIPYVPTRAVAVSSSTYCSPSIFLMPIWELALSANSKASYFPHCLPSGWFSISAFHPPQEITQCIRCKAVGSAVLLDVRILSTLKLYLWHLHTFSNILREEKVQSYVWSFHRLCSPWFSWKCPMWSNCMLTLSPALQYVSCPLHYQYFDWVLSLSLLFTGIQAVLQNMCKFYWLCLQFLPLLLLLHGMRELLVKVLHTLGSLFCTSLKFLQLTKSSIGIADFYTSII